MTKTEASKVIAQLKSFAKTVGGTHSWAIKQQAEHVSKRFAEAGVPINFETIRSILFGRVKVPRPSTITLIKLGLERVCAK